ncbi:MAG: energy transducer TonB [Rhodobacteraceae bacterium]|nr:energy transducer TonB [Paracoccaceae bacterium]
MAISVPAQRAVRLGQARRATVVGQARRAVMLGGAALALPLLTACEGPEGEIKSLKAQIQVDYGEKNFKDIVVKAEKALSLSLQVQGPKSGDTLYFAQALSEGYTELGDKRSAVKALGREITLRLGAGQSERKLQPRRTLAIKFAEETGDPDTAAKHALAISRDIEMDMNKDPQPVYRADTRYPPDQFRRNVEGDVTLEYAIDQTGKVTSAKVKTATPPNVFDNAALESFLKWRFTPVLKNGEPVASAGHTFTIMFRMRGQNIAPGR